MPGIKILVVDDHGMVREGLSMVLGIEPDLDVIGTAGTGEEGARQAMRLRPDVVVMDVLMEGIGGIEACRQIRSALPDTRVLMLTSHDTLQAVEASVLAGASGYLLKNGSREDLLQGVRAVAHGQSLLSPGVTAPVLERLADLTRKERERENDLLSQREKDVLSLVARGLTNRQIAAELVISDNTVRNHLSHILDKLGLTRRSQAAAYAVRHGLARPEDETPSP